MVETPSDAALLDRFVHAREEAAFAALVRRHSPRVERICRRILRDEHEIEDVRQATFLVLARKAGGIDWSDSVIPWIDGVARRLALHARSGTARRRARETPVSTLAGPFDGQLPERYHPHMEPSSEVERRDLRTAIDEALGQLPEKYRAPVVLCDLEGQTREEAARRLGWPTGSMSRRLDRARSMLRDRLTVRGVAIGLIGLVAIASMIRVGIDRFDSSSRVRTIMSALGDGKDGAVGYGSILAAVARGEVGPSGLEKLRPAARAAAEAGLRLQGARTDASGLLWDRLAHEMTEAAADLERACDLSDRPSMLAAAQRLDASCVRCHSAFRKEARPAPDRVSWRPVRRQHEAPRRVIRHDPMTVRPVVVAGGADCRPSIGSNKGIGAVVMMHEAGLRWFLRPLLPEVGAGDRPRGPRAGPIATSV